MTMNEDTKLMRGSDDNAGSNCHCGLNPDTNNRGKLRRRPAERNWGGYHIQYYIVDHHAHGAPTSKVVQVIHALQNRHGDRALLEFYQ